MGKIVKNTIITLLILTLGCSTAFLAYLHFFAQDERELAGEWGAQLELTEQAAVMAYGWLQDIEAVTVSLEEVKACMQDLGVRVDLELEPSGRLEGVFRCGIAKESYDACREEAYRAFAAVFRSLVAKRLHMAGYTGGTDEEAVEALVSEAFGMSTVSYLMSCGPELLPSLEALRARYGGSGVYKLEDGSLILQFMDGGADSGREERYIRTDTDLILYGETGFGEAELLFKPNPLRYTVKQPLSQPQGQ